MPLNKIALIRYKTIDRCLRDRSRNWTLEDLIEACSVAVNNIEGTNKGASKRTVQGDLQLMRDPVMGYHAPITVIAKKYYTYADANYSITKQPISKQDEGMIKEAVDFMKQLQDFDHFELYDKVVDELESILTTDTNNRFENEQPIEEKPFIPTVTTPPPTKLINTHILEQQGSHIVPKIYMDYEVAEIVNILTEVFAHQNLNENGTYFSLNTMPELERKLFNPNLQQLLSNFDDQLILTSSKYYHQIPMANWFTTLHQNITIPVKEKMPVDGFSGWSKKEGITSVMAPIDLLRQSISIYIHLSPSNETNGALQILPGSHKKILNIQERNQIIENINPQIYSLEGGDIHIVKPLVLQAFSKVFETQSVHLLQLDFATIDLPGGLAWLAS